LSNLAPTETVSTYTLKSGDSLWSIATKHNLTVAQLKSYNGMKTDVIRIGQVFSLVPNGQGTTIILAPSPVAPTTETQQQPVVSVSKVDALITEAKKYIGVPYVWGGSTTSGFDCSGYVNYVYNRVGVSIPRTVAIIWSSAKAISAPNVGDIVFFNTSGSGTSHAGIYLGNNQFIHAGTSTGVIISDMNNSYWKPRYLGAKTAF
jgi:peptidoglycan DL-endopeptidase LytE